MRCASSSLCASTSATLSIAGRSTALKRRPRAKLLALRRAFASTIGTPAVRAASSRFGQTSVSISTPIAGRNRAKKRRIAPGVSQGSQVW